MFQTHTLEFPMPESPRMVVPRALVRGTTRPACSSEIVTLGVVKLSGTGERGPGERRES
jgi:hypothetical protein